MITPMEFNEKSIVDYMKGDLESSLSVFKDMYYSDSKELPKEVVKTIKKLCKEYKERQRLKGNL